jgi:hypothetical protein
VLGIQSSSSQSEAQRRSFWRPCAYTWLTRSYNLAAVQRIVRGDTDPEALYVQLGRLVETVRRLPSCLSVPDGGRQSFTAMRLDRGLSPPSCRSCSAHTQKAAPATAPPFEVVLYPISARSAPRTPPRPTCPRLAWRSPRPTRSAPASGSARG